MGNGHRIRETSVGKSGNWLAVVLAALLSSQRLLAWSYYPPSPKAGDVLADASLAYGGLVTEVTAGSPAEKAGMRAGDVLIGVDGRRVFGPEEYLAVRGLNPDRADISVTIVRDDAALTLEAPQTLEYRAIGFQHETPRNAFVATLHVRDVFNSLRSSDPDAIKEIDPLAALTVAFEVAPEATGDDIELVEMLNALPRRAQLEICVLADKATAAELDWIRGFLLLYLDLRRQAFDAAAARAKTLAPAVGNPFLEQLADFYRAVAVRPADLSTGSPHADYDTDLESFFTCYPYPWVDDGLGNAFPGDPEFSKWVAIRFRGTSQDRALLPRQAYVVLNENHAPPYNFVGQVRAAVLDPDNHGGWPYRSGTISERSDAQKLFAAMWPKWREHPEQRGMFALSCIGPAVLHGDKRLLATALRQLAAEGPGAYRLGFGVMENARRHVLHYRTNNWGVYPAKVTAEQAAQALMKAPPRPDKRQLVAVTDADIAEKPADWDSYFAMPAFYAAAVRFDKTLASSVGAGLQAGVHRALASGSLPAILIPKYLVQEIAPEPPSAEKIARWKLYQSQLKEKGKTAAQDPHEAIVWTITSGNNLYASHTASFEVVQHDVTNGLGVADLELRQVLPLTNDVWVASNRGLFRFPRRDKTWTRVPLNQRPAASPIAKLEIRDDQLTVIDDDGKTATIQLATKENLRK